MAGKFAYILGALGLNSGTDKVTEAHLQAADDKIALLEQEKSAADLKADQAEAARVTAQTALDTATGKLTSTEASLNTATDKLATLEEWKKNQATTDNREEDSSNDLDNDAEPKAAWEVASATAVANARKRVGDK